jgi:hypothetical protein
LNRIIVVTDRHTNDSFRTTFASGSKAAMNSHLRTESITLTARPVDAVVFTHDRDSACEASIMQNFTGDSGSGPVKVSSDGSE